MTTYYVSPFGSDANNGLGPDPTAGTNKPWLTVGKALGAAGVASGDTVWLCPNVYREVVTVAMTSATVETLVTGDPLNTRGFKDGSGVLVPAGEVVISGWTTSDLVAGSASAVMAVGAHNFLTFDRIFFDGYIGVPISLLDSHNITLRRCLFVGPYSQVAIDITNTTPGGSAISIEQCLAVSSAVATIRAVQVAGSSAEYDCGLSITNCLVENIRNSGGTCISIAPAAGTFKVGGGLIEGCNLISAQTCVLAGPNTSRISPLQVKNNLMIGGGLGTSDPALAITATNTGSVEEDGNIIQASSARSTSGVPAVGLHTFQGTASNPPLRHGRFNWGQDLLFGLPLRPFGSPSDGSALLGLAPACRTSVAVPTSGTDDASIGSVAWTNPGNAVVPDGTNAVATSIPTTGGHYLVVTGGLAVPAGATIIGIRVVGAATPGNYRFNSIKLVKAGIISGTDLASAFTANIPTGEWEVGSVSDPLWGLSLSVADVNAANFGAAVSFKSQTGTTTVNLDWMRVVCDYIPSGGLPSVATVDLGGRQRPAGGSSLVRAAGMLERHDTAAKELTTVDAGGVGLVLAGPADHDIRFPVDAQATTITIKGRYDTNHGATTKPRAILLDAPEIGVTTQTVTMTAAIDTWETLTIGPFTPTAKGVVTVRLVGRPTAGTGKSFWDTAAATATSPGDLAYFQGGAPLAVVASTVAANPTTGQLWPRGA